MELFFVEIDAFSLENGIIFDKKHQNDAFIAIFV
jgi:hypothetical protein